MKICKTKRGLPRHKNYEQNQNKSNEILKHLSKEMLQMSLPKLISEVIEALSVNKWYKQNIREIFCNFLSMFQKTYTLKLKKC